MNKIQIFLLVHKNTLTEHFLNEERLAILNYLADIFDKLNCLNLSHHGKNTNILIIFDKIDAFKKKTPYEQII